MGKGGSGGAAGAWSRLPKAEWLIPEGLMLWWPSPVTRKNMSAANYPVSGLPLREVLAAGACGHHATAADDQVAWRRRGQTRSEFRTKSDPMCAGGPLGEPSLPEAFRGRGVRPARPIGKRGPGGRVADASLPALMQLSSCPTANR